ncbi:MAG: PQQ-binding-like beta-propeller repeat protein [Vicinamibacterales bacterium]
MAGICPSWQRSAPITAVLLLFVATNSIRGTSTPRGLVPQALPDAPKLFELHCATCHGNDGKGAERGPDIVSSRRAATRSLDEIQRIIRQGIPQSGMPPTTMGPPEIDAVARYLKKLAEAAQEPRTFRHVRLRVRDGRTIEGLVQNESNFDLQLLTLDGTLGTFSRDAIADLAELGRRVMPELKPRDVPVAWAPGDWPSYNGSDHGNRHTPLAQITPATVAGMRLKWTFPIPSSRNLKATPVVVSGVMYVTAPNEVFALDAQSGREIWHYSRPRTRGVIGDAGAGVNRGVALRGDRLYFVTDDARLVSLHRANGQLLWETTLADYRQHYGATGAPLVVDNLVVSGVSGGDEGVRGFLAAFDAITGKEVWRFWTVPAPGEPGSETWEGKAIEHGCAATWLTGSYDRATHTLYWTTGNPCPDYNGGERIGDNLWSNSLLALDPSNGRLRWFYQFTPHDLHDWDAVQTVILADVAIGGRERSVIMQANRNGFFYVLDRATGRVLLGKPFVTKMNWASGIDANGRPIKQPAADPSVRGTMGCPSVVGATNWMSPAFNPDTKLYYVMALERCSIFRKSGVWFEPGQSFYGGTTQNVPGEMGKKYLRALDVGTGKIVWEYPQLGPSNSWGGLLSTASGLVLFGEDSGAFAAVDARSGKLLWHFPANASWTGSPMTYLAGGQQFVAIAGGGTVFAFGL